MTMSHGPLPVSIQSCTVPALVRLRLASGTAGLDVGCASSMAGSGGTCWRNDRTMSSTWLRTRSRSSKRLSWAAADETMSTSIACAPGEVAAPVDAPPSPAGPALAASGVAACAACESGEWPVGACTTIQSGWPCS